MSNEILCLTCYMDGSPTPVVVIESAKCRAYKNGIMVKCPQCHTEMYISEENNSIYGDIISQVLGEINGRKQDL